MKTKENATLASNGREQHESFLQLAHTLGQGFAGRARNYDQNDAFVSENYAELKQHRIFSALVPAELGGMGMNHSSMCHFLRILGQYCGSTGLALSMHSHLMSANVWKYVQQGVGEATLRKVAGQQLVLVSTGARDWLDSNGTMEKVEGGFLVSAFKAFASQSAEGDILVTSAPYNDPREGAQVLHFPVPFAADGLQVLDDWYTMGMRGTGSCTVKLDKVFVPDEAIALRRPQGEYHQVWNVVLTVAMPLIMAVYVGIAEKAAAMALAKTKNAGEDSGHLPFLIGEMNNQLCTAQVVWGDMVRIANDLDFQPSHQMGHDILTRKTIVANAAIQTVTKAMEIVGGQSFSRKFGLERLFRDVQAANFHPLMEKMQQQFSGSFIMGEQ
ncbi:MAG: acyl-CoA/acyl-ACP dehydrogenase [Lewinellaceae bacterium]|nr:acyl-CoA/acyl-ACP dehydrogenase [Lewinellaceae bacterium]